MAGMANEPRTVKMGRALGLNAVWVVAEEGGASVTEAELERV